MNYEFVACNLLGAHLCQLTRFKFTKLKTHSIVISISIPESGEKVKSWKELDTLIIPMITWKFRSLEWIHLFWKGLLLFFNKGFLIQRQLVGPYSQWKKRPITCKHSLSLTPHTHAAFPCQLVLTFQIFFQPRFSTYVAA